MSATRSGKFRRPDYLDNEKGKDRKYHCYSDNIFCACEILKNEMTAPPGVLELASRVGLNHNHLIQGFKAMLGLTPFEYLRQIRLEKAKELIASRECNITEAAFAVGYANLSHFSKNFRKEFGVNPKEWARCK